MPPASSSHGFAANDAPLRRRIVPLALTVVIHLLLLLLLLQLAPAPFVKKLQDSLPVTFDIMPGPPAPTKNPKTADKARKAPEGASARAVSPAVIKPPKAPPTPDFPFVTLTRDELAAADIGKLPTRKSDQSGSGEGDKGMGQDRGAVSGPGEGPGGEQLYDADWYRRPTNAELATYMPANAPRTGYGLVACKTVENYRVENCQPLGESPLGSGFARAVRQAAWQFLVKPPRIGGRSMVGTWVRIRIDYIEGSVK